MKQAIQISSTATVVSNFLGFQLVWWMCVSSAQSNMGLVVMLLVCAYMMLHLQFIEGWHQAKPLLLTAILGCIFDQAVYWMGWITFPHSSGVESLIPDWMMALWLGFACTLNVSMKWLQKKYALAAVLGFTFGPLAYLGAHKLGAVNFPIVPESILVIGVEWAIVLPLCLYIRTYFNQQKLQQA